MAINFRKIFEGLNLVPKTSSTANSKGDMDVIDSSGKLNYHNGSSSSPIVTESHEATLTNKSIDADENTISNLTHGVEVDDPSSDVHGVSGDVVGTTDEQTLTNKTIDADNNTISNLEDGNIKEGADIARDKLASGDSDHVLINDENGVLSSEEFLDKSRGGSGQDNSDLEFPSEGTLATLHGEEEFTNKSFGDEVTLAEISTPPTPDSGYGKIYFKDDGFLYQMNDDGSESKVGAGSGGINYVGNPDAESNTNGWSTYADAAAALPVDGTGGSPNVTLSRVTSSPLRGTAMFRLTKDAANRQGQGVSTDFTIAEADKAKVLNISFDYKPSSNFVSGSDSATGDLNVYIYDVTNAQIIQPAPFKLPGGSGHSWKYSGTFQSASNSTSYRLIFHIADTTSAAWTFDFDNVIVGPQVQLFGAPVTDWADMPVPVGGWFVSGPTAANAKVLGRRVGDSLELFYSFRNFTGTWSAVELRMPAGHTINTTKEHTLTINANRESYGEGSYGSAATEAFSVKAVSNNTENTFLLRAHRYITGTDVRIAQELTNSLVAATSTSYLVFRITVPILGWGSNVLMSNDTDTRVVACRAYRSSTQSIPTTVVTDLVFNTVTFDTHNAFNTSTGVFTAPVSGMYRISASVEIQGNSTGERQVIVRKNSFHWSRLAGNFSPPSSGLVLTGSEIVPLNAGETLRLRFYQSSGVSLNFAHHAGDYSYIHIVRLSGPATIAASETVSARYKTAAGQSIATGGSAAIVNFGTKDFDSHGATSTGVSWKFTAPISGIYQVSSMLHFGNGSGWDAGEAAEMHLYKNNSQYTVMDSRFQVNTHSQHVTLHSTTSINLNAGDYIDIRVYQTSGASRSLQADNQLNWVSIHRIGN